MITCQLYLGRTCPARTAPRRPSACPAEHVEPLLERYGVQLYLAGHDHDLELQRGPGSGVTHVLTGAGSETRGFRGTTDSLFQHVASGAALARTHPFFFITSMDVSPLDPKYVRANAGSHNVFLHKASANRFRL